MRINKFLAMYGGLSRRSADQAVKEGRVRVDEILAEIGQDVTTENVSLDGKTVAAASRTTILLLNKPVGYVCSRSGQGSKTVYDLLPPEYHGLKPVGRLDKDSSGLLVMTNDGRLAYELTHPKFRKEKVYVVTLDKTLKDDAKTKIDAGVQLEDGASHLKLAPAGQNGDTWEVRMSEGRNRQIRRTFAAAGYEVITLHRTHFGDYDLGGIEKPGNYCIINSNER